MTATMTVPQDLPAMLTTRRQPGRPLYVPRRGEGYATLPGLAAWLLIAGPAAGLES
jgi:hypothetical protein